VISTGEYCFPLWTRIVVPTISGRIIMSRAWVFTVVFCPSCLVFLMFSMRMRCCGVSPLCRVLLWRDGSMSMNSSIDRAWSCWSVYPR